MTVEYDSNNSGGHWWLSDEDWFALEKAGWAIDWNPEESGSMNYKYKNPPSEKYPGKYLWLGAIAKGASYECKDIVEAIKSFEEATGQDSSDEGCNCCGPPHSFSYEEGDKSSYISGEDILPVLFKGKTMSLREAYEKEKV